MKKWFNIILIVIITLILFTGSSIVYSSQINELTGNVIKLNSNTCRFPSGTVGIRTLNGYGQRFTLIIQSITKQDAIVSVNGISKVINENTYEFFPNTNLVVGIKNLTIDMWRQSCIGQIDCRTYYPVQSIVTYVLPSTLSCVSMGNLPIEDAYTIKIINQDLPKITPLSYRFPRLGPVSTGLQSVIDIEAINPNNIPDTGVEINNITTSKLLLYLTPVEADLQFWIKNEKENTVKRINNIKITQFSTVQKNFMINIQQIPKKIQRNSRVYGPIILTYNNKNIPVYIIWSQYDKVNKGVIAVEYEPDKFFNIYIEAAYIDPIPGRPEYLKGYMFAYLGHTYGPENLTAYDIIQDSNDVSDYNKDIPLNNGISIKQYYYDKQTKDGTSQNDEVRIKIK